MPDAPNRGQAACDIYAAESEAMRRRSRHGHQEAAFVAAVALVCRRAREVIAELASLPTPPAPR